MTKNEVIAILRKSEGYVSGEEISQTLGISRAAVNSAVKSLRRDGYDILSSTNRGYKLNGYTDKLNTGELLALLPARRLESVVCLETVDSTNNYLRTLAQNGAPDGQTVISNMQTGGRGRLGRSFFSPENKGVYLSMLMRPESLPAETSSITAWVAVAMCNAVESACGVRPGIKWVNDLVMNGRKICGILTEMSLENETAHIQYLITGIGINANHSETDFPEDIRHIASSIAAETGRKINRAGLAQAMILELDRLRADWPHEKQKYLAAYRRDCITLGKEVHFVQNGAEFIAFAKDIDDFFGLVIRFPDGRSGVLTSGEVSVRGLYGYV